MQFYVTKVFYIYMYTFWVTRIQGCGKNIIYYYTYCEKCDVNKIAIFFEI